MLMDIPCHVRTGYQVHCKVIRAFILYSIIVIGTVEHIRNEDGALR